MVQVNHPNPPEFNHSFCMLIKFAYFLPSADFFFFFFEQNKSYKSYHDQA